MNNTHLWQIWGYDPVQDDFRPFDSIQAWESQIDRNGAVKYLKNHLKKSLINDFEPAYNVYVRDLRGIGYFALLRIIFPVIDFLGALYQGNSRSQNAVQYMKDYMSKYNENYKNIGDIIFLIFRHGLIHTQMPKVLLFDNVNIGWVITYNDSDHLVIGKRGLKPINIMIAPHQLYLDILNSIDDYIIDLLNENKTDLLNNFKKGFIEMTIFYTKKGIMMNCNEGFSYLKKYFNDFIF